LSLRQQDYWLYCSARGGVAAAQLKLAKSMSLSSGIVPAMKKSTRQG
jgi:hypothetical protein